MEQVDNITGTKLHVGSMTATKGTVEDFNRTSVSTSNAYKATNLGIRQSDETTRDVISTTFGIIKHNLSAFWNSVGLDPNVNIAYEQAMLDPKNRIEIDNKVSFKHPAQGKMKPYNELGNPAGGIFTMELMA